MRLRPASRVEGIDTVFLKFVVFDVVYHGKPVIAFCGAAGEGADACHAVGVDAYFPILRRVESLEEALDPVIANQNLTDTAEQVFRLIQLYT